MLKRQRITTLLSNFVWIFLGAASTYLLTRKLTNNSVIAACLCVLLYSPFKRKVNLSCVYTGSFIAMSSRLFIGSWENLILTSFFAGIITMIFESRFKGVGGKLGTIAFASSIPLLINELLL